VVRFLVVEPFHLDSSPRLGMSAVAELAGVRVGRAPPWNFILAHILVRKNRKIKI
jgi:hypothetical protein